MQFDHDILNLNAPVVFFPVRHHSPACARILRQLALELRPTVVLIEGPSDFNSQISQLFLPHKLPIAIYSYVALMDETRRGAFYPFCVYSPEWQALQISNELNIPAEFIDLPWADMASLAIESHRYADMELGNSVYTEALCENLGVEGLNDLWDLLFEIDPYLTTTEYLARCHKFCFHTRLSYSSAFPLDLPRENFMASRIEKALSTNSGQILVVTGGFHSYALYAKIFNRPFPQPEAPIYSTGVNNENIPDNAQETGTKLTGLHTQQQVKDKGIALTPFSYERLDSLTGYDAGMPSPGFYDQVWHDRLTNNTDTYRKLLARVVLHLRSHNQVFSSADLIAVEVTAKGLAAFRGHSVVWRQDLIDGIIASLVKEPLDANQNHPFLIAVYDVLRGDIRGRLADGTFLPSLVQDIKRLLQKYDLEPTKEPRLIDLNLHLPLELKKSRILNQLRILGIAGFQRTSGSNLFNPQDLSDIWEQWGITLNPLYEASCIENSIYGSTLAEAVKTRLLELAACIERDAKKAALLILDACLAGLQSLAKPLYQKLLELIREDNNFLSVTGALEDLLFLYLYDEVLGTASQSDIGQLLLETFTRSLWLLESLGQIQGNDQQLLQGIKVLFETFERCKRKLNLNHDGFIDVLQRVNTDSSQTPLLRGAACGVLWTLGTAPTEQILLDLRSCAQADLIGDFLTGLFCLAREVVQRYPNLLMSIDELINSFDDETFLEALPALHLAFTYFTPREKHNIASSLVKVWRDNEEDLEQDLKAPPKLEVSAEVAAQVLAFERKFFAAVKRYGLRGGNE